MSRTGRIVLLPVLLLGGCGAGAPRVATRIEVVQPRVPPSLLVCPPAPAVPAATRQSEVAGYVAELWRAHEVCHEHLGAVAQTLRALPGQAVPGAR